MSMSLSGFIMLGFHMIATNVEKSVVDSLCQRSLTFPRRKLSGGLKQQPPGKAFILRGRKQRRIWETQAGELIAPAKISRTTVPEVDIIHQTFSARLRIFFHFVYIHWQSYYQNNYTEQRALRSRRTSRLSNDFVATAERKGEFAGHKPASKSHPSNYAGYGTRRRYHTLSFHCMVENFFLLCLNSFVIILSNQRHQIARTALPTNFATIQQKSA